MSNSFFKFWPLISASSLSFLEVLNAGQGLYNQSTGVLTFLVIFVSFLLFSIVNVTASLTVEIKTILDDPFIKLLVDRVNNLKHKHVEDILNEDLGDTIPESEDNIIETTKSLTQIIDNLKLAMV